MPLCVAHLSIWSVAPFETLGNILNLTLIDAKARRVREEAMGMSIDLALVAPSLAGR
jgi:hypothetical protein